MLPSRVPYCAAAPARTAHTAHLHARAYQRGSVHIPSSHCHYARACATARAHAPFAAFATHVHRLRARTRWLPDSFAFFMLGLPPLPRFTAATLVADSVLPPAHTLACATCNAARAYAHAMLCHAYALPLWQNLPVTREHHHLRTYCSRRAYATTPHCGSVYFTMNDVNAGCLFSRARHAAASPRSG